LPPPPNPSDGAQTPRDRRRELLQAPIAAAIVTLIPGVVGLAAGQLWLFPSLGPTALMQAHAPEHRTSRPYNVIVGHVVGLAASLFAVWIFGIAKAPSVFQTHALSWPRVLAAALAILIATALEVIFRAPHPPAASTTLLVALGSFKATGRDIADVLIGVAIVAIAGEVMRRMRLSARQSSIHSTPVSS
jgi:CBS-domain-containing membrane protein